MDAILAIPLPIRLVALAVVGAVVGGFINLGVYRLAWRQRSISPWSVPLAGAPSRGLRDRIPIFGWPGLRRESGLHGRGFWIRPLAVELLSAAVFAGLYLWELDAPPLWQMANGLQPPIKMLSSNLPLIVHARYLSHIVVFSLMLVATLIDIDEKTIPDEITVPGTWIGLLFATVYPWSLLPAGDWIIGPLRHVEFLTLLSPDTEAAALGGLPLIQPLAIGLGCWTLWCGGLLPRRWNVRHGLKTAVRVFFHRLRKDLLTYQIASMWIIGAIAIAAVAWKAPLANWVGLLTALVGMAAGGGIIWVVRIVGTAALRREAMGFGDVTLLAMIGSFVGWQTALLVFFLAPFMGIVVGVLQWIAHGEHEIPYGPFLCLATCGAIVEWRPLWDWARPIFAMGWLLPALLACCMGLMAGMLLGYRLILQIIAGTRGATRR